MQTLLRIFILLLVSNHVNAQQSKIQGEVSIFNSKYEAKKREYVQNAQVEENFDRATPQTTDDAGRFGLIIKGVKDNQSITFKVKKNDLEVVNIDALKAIAGQYDTVRIYMAAPQYIEGFRRKIYHTGLDPAKERLEKQIIEISKKLHQDSSANKYEAEVLQRQINQLERQVETLSEQAEAFANKYALINLDDCAPIYVEIFNLYINNKVEQALSILNLTASIQEKNIILAQKKRDFYMEQGRIQDSIQRVALNQLLPLLQLQADIYQNLLHFDSAAWCYRRMLILDSLNVETLTNYGRFLYTTERGIAAEKCLKRALLLSPDQSFQKIKVLRHLGTLAFFNNEQEKSLQYLIEAKTMVEQSVELEKQGKNVELLKILNNISTTLLLPGRDTLSFGNSPEIILQYLKQANQCYLAIHKDQKSRYSNEFASILNNIGIALMLVKDSWCWRANKYSLALFKKALNIRRKLALPNDLRSRFFLAETLNNIGTFYVLKNDTVNANKNFNESFALLEPLFQAHSWVAEKYRNQSSFNLLLAHDQNNSIEDCPRFRLLPSPITNGLVKVSGDDSRPESDEDGDGFLNRDDHCPYLFGTVNGCPNQDSDGDGLIDYDDNCPYAIGLVENRGCPDRDGDGVQDRNDHCPDDSGLPELAGCPDKDCDGWIDLSDNCPTLYGTLNGCPDADGDGIADHLDHCPDVAGTLALNGCPLTQSMARDSLLNHKKISKEILTSLIKDFPLKDPPSIQSRELEGKQILRWLGVTGAIKVNKQELKALLPNGITIYLYLNTIGLDHMCYFILFVKSDENLGFNFCKPYGVH
ncbi:thrombospondin type 3 repeat-containing protein [Runella sp.]|uniref:tetratricopeptide repeat protein n=1 Tax=Runella sp. TaxID=1960881 RepID=UPI003019DFD5